MNSYIKASPRGTPPEIERIINMLPQYTDDLNETNRALIFIRRLKKILDEENNGRTIEAMIEIEKLGVFNQFLGICLLDFLVVYKNALLAIHVWDELYSLRQGYLLIHEVLKTYNAHNKSLNELISSAPPGAESLLRSLAVEIRQFKKDFKYDSLIAELRNNTIGHIEEDPVSFFDRLSKFDTDRAVNALKKFALILGEMLRISELIFKTYVRNMSKEVAFDGIFRGSNLLEVQQLLEELDPNWRGQS